jgi:transglutaminase-like putative cysteine protease
VIPEPRPTGARAWGRRIVRALRHPLRLALATAAVAAAVAPLGSAWMLTFAVLGAIVGLIVGEVLGRSPLRLAAISAIFLVFAVIAAGLARLLVAPAAVPAVLGPVAPLWVSTAIGAFALTAAPLGWLRAAAGRAQALAVVEIGAYAALFVSLVATHRDGAISRPLWLSDLTWSLGVDPGRALLALGIGLATLLIALRLLDADRRLPTVGLAWLPALAVAGALLAAWIGVTPEPLPERLLDLQEGGDEVAEGEDPRNRTPQSGDADPDTGDGGGGSAGRPPPARDRDGDGKPDDPPPQPNPGEGDPTEGRPEGGDGGRGENPADGRPQDGKPEDGDDPAGAAEQAPDPLAEREPGGGDSPMAVVLIDDDHVPASGYWYLRQQVLSDYTGVRLVPATAPGVDRDALSRFPVALEPVPDAPSADGRAVVHGSVSLLVPHETPFAPESPASLSPRGNPNPVRFVGSYHFVSHALDTPVPELVGRQLGDPAWTPEIRDHYLRAPDDPRYRALAESWIAGLPEPVRDDDLARAVVIAHELGASMKYTLRARYPDAEDPTAAFLFGPRVGYCVHSAHAAAYLWRSVGIPARVATGYAVSEDERRGSVLLVKGRHAHAWPEIHVEGLGWIPLDVAPSEDLDATQQGAPEEDEIALLGEMAREAPPPDAQARADWSWIWRPLRIFALSVTLGGAALALGGHYATKAWRRLRPSFSPPRALPRTAYRAALDALAELGLTREHGETREAFARRVADLAPSFAALTALHQRALLGPTDRPDPPDDLRDALAATRAELRDARPWWRRLAGLADPTSLYRAR